MIAEQILPGADGDILRAGLSMNVTYVGGMFVMLGHTFALVLMIVERQMVDLRRLARFLHALRCNRFIP